MPCSGCGRTGHNIRTCASGPTPGGVNGMRGRSSVSSYSSASQLFAPGMNLTLSPSYDFDSDYGSRIVSYGSSRTTSGNELYENTMARFASFKDEIIQSTDDKFSDVKRLVKKIDDKFEKQLEKFQENSENESLAMSELVSKIEYDSQKQEQRLNKFMYEMQMAKRETIQHIDNKFNAISKSFAAVDQKTKENEKHIKKHSEEIGEIKAMLVHLIENQETKKPKAGSRKYAYDSSEDEEEQLMSPEEMIRLSHEMIKSLKGCRSKQDQFKVITSLALKYVNEE